MIYSQRMLFCGNIISQCQIQFKGITYLTCDRCNGIMRFSLCLCKNKCSLICISSPHFQNMCSQIHQTFLILMTNSQYGKRPFYNSSLHILISRNGNCFLNRCLCHCKGIMSSLEMIMTENGASYNWQVRIGTQKIMRKQFYKIK